MNTELDAFETALLARLRDHVQRPNQTGQMEVNRPEDADGLANALAVHDVRADIIYVPGPRRPRRTGC